MDFATVAVIGDVARIVIDVDGVVNEERRIERQPLTELEAGLPCFTPRGAYYIMTAIDGMGFADDVEFVRYLVTEIGVAAVPGSSFFRDTDAGCQLVRFCFCKREETFAEAEARLKRLRVGSRSA